MEFNDEDPVVIVGSARTPIGAMLGAFESLKAPELGSIAIKAAIERAQLTQNDINEVLMGCVLTAGVGQAPARQAAILAGIPTKVPATTINKVCGSGMKTVMLAHDILLREKDHIIVAGGMESMTNAPYLLDKARKGYRLGHAQLKDHLMFDGLEDAYDQGKSMGLFAETTAEKYNHSREKQDEFAKMSLTRAQTATKEGKFNTNVEITPVTITTKKGETIIVQQDELPTLANLDKIPHLKPAFKENGTITAANSSSISDGAAALVLMRLSEAKKRQLKPIAKILGFASFAEDPAWFTRAPIGAIQALWKKLEWTEKHHEIVDLYEINEAFATVTLVAMNELHLPHDKVNIHGGACALGHPIGASGTRLICTLLGALIAQNKKRGIASLCIGGGEATALALELL